MIGVILNRGEPVMEGELKKLLPSSKNALLHLHEKIGFILDQESSKSYLENKDYMFFFDSDVIDVDENFMNKLLNDYRKHGTASLKTINGAFAFVLWDKQKGRLVMATDRLGLKDLFYHKKGNDLIITSRIRQMINSSLVDKTIDPESLSNYLCYQFVPKPLTMFRGIRKVPPTKAIVFKQGRMDFIEYCDFEFSQSSLPTESIGKELKDIVIKAVETRMKKGRKAGILLSGGLDSTIIASAMRNLAPSSKIYGFTGGFSGQDGYESFGFGKRVADDLGIESREVVIKENAVQKLPEIYGYLDEPLADSAIVQSHALFSESRKATQTVFSGEFSDVIFAGMQNYPLSRVERDFWGMLSKKQKSEIKQAPGTYVTSEFVHNVETRSAFLHYKHGEIFFNNGNLKGVASPSFYDSFKGVDLSKPIEAAYRNCKSNNELNKEIYTDLHLASQRRLYHLTEPAKMNGVGLMLPFTDVNVINYSLRIPPELKIRGLTQKYILRKAFKNYIPAYVLDRKKEGFTMPFTLWYNNSYDWIMEQIRKTEMHGFFDGNRLEHYIKGIIDKRNQSYEKNMYVWILLNFVSWSNSVLGP
jgi:asparagine synthase (glutamine-hydrolysing)